MNNIAEDNLKVMEKIVFDTIKNRRSVRKYKDKKIPDKDLEKIIQAGIYAPSGSNSQNQRFLLISEEKELKKIGLARYVWPYKTASKMRKKKPSGIIGDSPHMIVVFADAALTDSRPNGEYYIWESMEAQNSAASIQNMLLMATSMGIGTVWISANEKMSGTRLVGKQIWHQILNDYRISPSMKIQGLVLLGYPMGYDKQGFPKGEKMHGATFWGSTQRRNLDYYMIKAKEKTARGVLTYKNFFFIGIATSILVKIKQFLLFGVKILDYLSFTLECKFALRSQIEERAKEVLSKK